MLKLDNIKLSNFLIFHKWQFDQVTRGQKYLIWEISVEIINKISYIFEEAVILT